MILQDYIFHHEAERRRRDQKLVKTRLRLDIRKCSFSNKLLTTWNSLSERCKMSNIIMSAVKVCLR